MHGNDFSSAVERYKRDLKHWEQGYSKFVLLTGTPNKSPTLEDVDEVLEAVALLDRCHVGRSQVTYGPAYRQRDMYMYVGSVERYTVPPSLAPEHEDWEQHGFRARARHTVVKKMYGKARQWLQKANITPPNPDYYTYEYEIPGRGPGKLRQPITPWL